MEEKRNNVCVAEGIIKINYFIIKKRRFIFCFLYFSMRSDCLEHMNMNNMLFFLIKSQKLTTTTITNNIIQFQNQGTCFLFHCGPSQNFRCKFTHHANYTSAVLTPEIKRDEPTKPVNTYPAQIVPVAISQHEMELSSLKDKPHR